VIESLMLSHPPEELQFVLADLKGGSAVKPFAGVPHVSRIITDLEEDQALMERFLDALWGEIARRKAVCDNAGVDDAKEYNSVRSRMRARGQDMPPLPMLVVVIDEFYEWFRIMPTAVDVLDSIGRQGRAYWIHLMMASQTIESRAEKLMENMGYRLVLKARTAGAAQAAGVPNAVNLPAQAGLGYFRKSLEDIIRFQAEFLWRDYYARGADSDGDETPRLAHSIDYVRPQLFTNSFTPLEVSVGGPDVDMAAAESNGEVLEAEGEESEDEEGIRTPKVGTVIIDQLRKIPFEPYRLWQPPLTQPVAIDELVNRFLGRDWQRDYGSAKDLVFPIGIIDRPFKHDQPPWTVDTSGPGANVLILGAGGSGKTTALQTLICSAALTHTPEQVQFYCLAYSSTALTTIAGLPHVGEVVGPTDPYGVRRTVAELLALVRERKRSFLEYGIASMEVFRRRKFGGAAGPVPDVFGDVYLVIDNYRALAEENEVLIEQVNLIINQGPSFGVHVVVTADRESELRPPVRSGFGSRVELRLAAVEDAKLVRSRFAKDVPVKPGRGMVAVNYVRLDSDPQAGLHTLVARPALGSTPDNNFESDTVVEAVSRLASGQARPVRRLPARFGVEQVRELAARDTREGVGEGGIAWAISELDLQPVYLNFAENAHLMVTGRRECGRTTTLATIMAEIGRLYVPGASSAPTPPAGQPSAQVWLVDPRRQLLTVLGPEYVEKFAYNLDGVQAMMGELAAILASRQPPPGLSAEELLSRSWWSGPEIFLIVDDIQQLPPGFDSPLQQAAPWVTRAADVGLHVLVTRTFGGWSSAGSDPILRALHQANAPLLVMDADPDEGFIRGKMKGGPLPRGRGLLMAEDTGVFVQVAATELRK
jgi:ESX secretion system protein EccC